MVLEGYAAPTEVFAILSRMPQADTRWPNLDDLLQKSLIDFRKYVARTPIGMPRYLYWSGYAHLLSGRRKKAQEMWHKSLQIAVRFAMPLEQGFAHFALDTYID